MGLPKELSGEKAPRFPGGCAHAQRFWGLTLEEVNRWWLGAPFSVKEMGERRGPLVGGMPTLSHPRVSIQANVGDQAVGVGEFGAWGGTFTKNVGEESVGSRILK